MTRQQLTPPAGVLVAIDVAKARNEVLIEVPGSGRRRRLSVLNTRAEHDRLIALLSDLSTSAEVSAFVGFQNSLPGGFDGDR